MAKVATPKTRKAQLVPRTVPIVRKTKLERALERVKSWSPETKTLSEDDFDALEQVSAWAQGKSFQADKQRLQEIQKRVEATEKRIELDKQERRALAARLVQLDDWHCRLQEAAAGAQKSSVEVKSIDDAIDDNLAWLDEKLQTMGDDAQLANLDLQNILQKQQQILQMVSTISKLINDTMMAVIRKMGG